jgi:hypothetical protein
MDSGQSILVRLVRLALALLAREYKMTVPPTSRRRLTAGFLALNHTLEVADFYIAIKEALENGGGAILSWLGDRQSLHGFYHQGRQRAIAPDAYCLWSLKGKEGSFFVEWERGHHTLNIIGQARFLRLVFGQACLSGAPWRGRIDAAAGVCRAR